MYRKWMKIEFSAEKHAPIDLNRLFNAINQLYTLVLTHPYLHKPFSIFDISHRWLTGAVLVPNWSEKWDFWPIYVFAKYGKYLFVEINATLQQVGWFVIIMGSFQYPRCHTGDVIGAILVPNLTEKWAFWPLYAFARYWKYIFCENKG